MGQKCNTPILTCKNDIATGTCAHQTQWDEWAKPDGDLGPVYGVQWRSWPNFCCPDRERRRICY